MNNEPRVFAYSCGSSVRDGDRIVVAQANGTIEAILQPHTQEARDYDVFESGGLLLRFDNGDLQLWPEPDEDLIFVSRSNPP
jgi:hypothetical protein